MRARSPLATFFLLTALALGLAAPLTACSSSSTDGTPAGSSGASGSAPPPSGGAKPGSLPAGECTGGRHCNVPDLHTCFQWKTGDSQANAQHEELCTGYGGSASDGACPTENVVAGCKTALGGDGCAVNWGYGPVIADDDVRSDCERQGGELIDK